MFYLNNITNVLKKIKSQLIFKKKIIIKINKKEQNFILDYTIIDDFIYDYYYEYVSECNVYTIIINSRRSFHNGMTTTTNYINILDKYNIFNSILGYHQRKNGFEAYNSHIEIINYNYKNFSSRGIFKNVKYIEYYNSENIIKLIIQ